MAQATLTSPDKKYKTVVDVGSADASQLQSRGWNLGDAGTNVLGLSQALAQGGNVAPTPAPQAPVATASVATAPAPQPQPTQPTQQPQQQPQAPAPTTPPQGTTQPPVQNPQPTPPPSTAPAQQATLMSPDGLSKTVVTVGSGEAAQLQAQGWKLGAPPNANVVTAQQALMPAPQTPTAQPQQQNQTSTPSLLDTLQNPDSQGNYDFSNFDFGGGQDNLTTDPITTQLLSKYGVTPPSASGNPVQDYASTYNQLISSMGLTDIKSQFAEVQKKYSDLQNELNGKIADINDDPWLSEGVRVGQIKRMQDRYEGKLQILNEQQKLYDSLYQQGVQQAQYVANAAFQQQQFNSQQAFNVANLALKEQEARASLKSANMRDQLAIAQEMRMIASQDSDNKQRTVTNSLNSIKTLADMFGGSVFDNMPASEKRKWEQSAGLPKGTLDNLGRTIEEQNLALEAQRIQQTSNNNLTPGQIQSSINQITGAFDNEPIVKNYNIIGEAKQFVDSLGNKANPTSTDDQGLIYAFAKAMDPNSAVKEGEYLTIQKYSQSLIQSGLANAERMLKNVAFLTPDARANMVATVNSKYQSSKQSYDNLYSEYNRRIEDAKTGNITGSLPNYGAAFEKGGTATSLPPLDRSYTSIEALLKNNPDYLSYIQEQLKTGADEITILKSLSSGKPVAFNLGMSGTPTAQNIKLGSNLARLNNNPGNLRFVGQAGASQGEGGFARFSTPQAGYQALLNQINLDASRGLTLAQFINKYAPPSENDTGLYLQQMAKATGASANTPLKSINLNALGKAMALKESSTVIA